MTDPAQDAAARAALEAGAQLLGVDVGELVVHEGVRRRRRNTKEPFYYVRVVGPAGDERLFQVSYEGTRVEPERGTFGLDQSGR